MKGVCFYGESVAEALRGKKLKGGAELQIGLLARTLAGHGVPVTVVDPEASAAEYVSENLTVVPVKDWEKGIRGIRFFTHRLPHLVRTFRETGAAVCYVRGFSVRHLIPLIAAKRMGAKFVLATASDTDLLGFGARYRKGYKGKASLWDWVSAIIPDEGAYRLLLRSADAVFVQHSEQAALARPRTKHVVQLNNVLDPEISTIRNNGARENILIVGTLSVAKGLRVLVPIVRKLRSVTFEFIGDAVDNEGRTVRTSLLECPNVILHGPLDRRQTLGRIATAKALVNTSPREGFPNTFVEAWALRTPVISLFVDPDGVLRRNRLGYFCEGNTSVLEELIQRTSYDLDTDYIQQYVLREHSAEQAVRAFRNIIDDAPQP